MNRIQPVTVTLANGNVVTHTAQRAVTHALLVTTAEGEGVFSWHGSAAAANKGKSMARRCTYTDSRVVPID